MGIPYASLGCGRRSSHISFTDKNSYKKVGQTLEYGVQALQSIRSGPIRPTRLSILSYRIPFLVQVSGLVKSNNGVGVAGVTVSFCRIDPVTNSPDPNYCPTIAFVTDSRGSFTG